MRDFIQALPKAELHVHLEGTLEPELSFELAQKNNIDLPYETPQDIIDAYDFHDLPSFLTIYYAAMNVLQTEDDFYQLTWQYLQKASADNIVYAELFFDPQAHTSRGVAFDTIIKGIHQAQIDAVEQLGIETQLILCFLRDMSAESAMEHLQMSVPYQDWIVGVGLDSDEKDNPPAKFANVFAKAKAMGYKLTMHCDVNQLDTLTNIEQCLNDIKVDRIDHGVNCLQNDKLWQQVKERGLGLTVCPVSNQFVVQSLTSKEIGEMLDKELLVTINSDDPAYFRAYLNDNLIALQEEGQFNQQQMQTLIENSFKVAWLDDASQKQYLNQVKQQAQRYRELH